MATERLGWEKCSQDDCIGSRLDGVKWCLAHLAEKDPDGFDAELRRIRQQGTIDGRGVHINSELLTRLIAAVPRDDDGRLLFGDANFERAVFQTWFLEPTQGSSIIVPVTFQGPAVFDGATFQGPAVFHWARFQHAATFNRAIFHSTAGFVSATFMYAADYLWATFHGIVEFSEATFYGYPRFHEATFHSTAYFQGATFHKDADFSGVVFKDAYEFGPMLVNRSLVLDRAAFHQRIRLAVAAEAVSANRTRFLSGTQLRVRWATVTLADADLSAPSVLTGIPTDFPDVDEDEFARRWRQLPPGPPERRWRPRLLSVQRADVAGLRVADVDLRACRFVGAHNLDRLRIEGEPLFARTQGWWRARRKTLAEEQHWRATRPGRWHASGWYPHACQPPASPEDEEPAEPLPVVLGPARLATLYRELRKGREDAKDEPGAADFYYGEMEMRRHDPGIPTAERLVLWLYWLLSGYALRAWRALVALAVVIALAGIGLSQVGFHHPHPSLAASWLYALQATVSLEGKARQLSGQLTLPGELLRVGLRFTGPVLLALAVLSVRGRVRR